MLSLPHSIFLPVGKSPWQPFYPYHSPGGFLHPAGMRYAMPKHPQDTPPIGQHKGRMALASRGLLVSKHIAHQFFTSHSQGLYPIARLPTAQHQGKGERIGIQENPMRIPRNPYFWPACIPI